MDRHLRQAARHPPDRGGHDGTLLDGDSNIPDDFWPLLDELHAKGVEFVPASGRQLATLRSMFADRVDGAMSYIAENGNVVVADDNVIDVHGVSWDITRTLIDLVDAAVASGSHDIGLVVCGLNTAYIQRQDRPFVEECSKYYKALRIVDDLHEVLETEDETVLKLAIFDFGDAQGMAANLLGDVERTHQVVVSGAHCRYHESRNRQAAGCRRAAAASRRHARADGGVRRLSQRLQMLDAGGWSFAMANAHPDLKRAARYIAPANTEHGVLQVVRRLV